MSLRNRYFPAAYVLNRLLRLLLPAVLVAVAGKTAQSQEESLHEGSRVRIDSHSSRRVTGVVKSFDSDSVRLFTDENGATVSLARNDVTGIRISHGKSAGRGAIRGAMWGTAVGGVLGVLYLAAIESDDAYVVTDEDRVLALNTILGGAIWGTGIGAFVKRERWETVSMRPRFSHSSSGVGLGLSLQSALLH